MPLRAENCRTFTRSLFAGMLETVTLLKRDNDQRQGTVRSITLFDCRRGKISKTGQTIEDNMSSDNRTVWHIPRRELDRVGVAYLNALDRIVDKYGDYWQAESTTNIEVKLFKVEIDLECLAVNPPKRRN